MRFVDRTGQRFARLTVMSLARRVRTHTLWLCQCDCGNEVEVRADSLKTGNTQSCGCLGRVTGRRHGRRITFAGQTWTVAQWSRILGIKPSTIYNRIACGWPDERVLTAPLRNERRRK